METRLTGLEERVARLEVQLREHAPRLDDHDRQLTALRGELRTLSVAVGRLSDIATTQGLTLERVAKNTERLLELAEAPRG